jgi:hypothetical protein
MIRNSYLREEFDKLPVREQTIRCSTNARRAAAE